MDFGIPNPPRPKSDRLVDITLFSLGRIPQSLLRLLGREERLGPPYSRFGGSNRSFLPFQTPRSLFRGSLRVLFVFLSISLPKGEAASYEDKVSIDGELFQGRFERFPNATVPQFPGTIFDSYVFVGYTVNNFQGTVVYTPVKKTLWIEQNSKIPQIVFDLKRLGRPIIVENGETFLAKTLNRSSAEPTAVPDGASGRAQNLSRDGSTVVGYYDNGFSAPFHAFVWTEETDVVDIGTLDPENNDSLFSYATDVSSDGSVVVGYSQIAGGTVNHAFRWTNSGGMVDLGSAAGPEGYSAAYGVSSDGSVIVGESDFPDASRKAFRWTEVDGFEELGTIDGTPRSLATAISADGNTIVGMAFVNVPSGNTTVGRRRAFRWTEAEGMQDLGVLTDHEYSAATAVSDDGETVAGFSSVFLPGSGIGTPFGEPTEFDRAFVWTEADGTLDLGQALEDAGVDMTDNTLLSATGVSLDGDWISCVAITPDTLSGETTSVVASLTFTLAAPGVSGLSITGLIDTVRLSFDSTAGVAYEIQKRQDNGIFNQLDTLIGTGERVQYETDHPPVGSTELFRVKAAPVP